MLRNDLIIKKVIRKLLVTTVGNGVRTALRRRVLLYFFEWRPRALPTHGHVLMELDLGDSDAHMRIRFHGGGIEYKGWVSTDDVITINAMKSWVENSTLI